MIFGKHINKYYIRHGIALLIGILALTLVDYFQLKIPELYRMVINGTNNGFVTVRGEDVKFDIPFLLSEIALPMMLIIVAIVFGRFLWRICIFGSAIKVETDLRDRMFSHSRLLSQEFYQTHKVGNMMSLYTNDLETVQQCFGNGVLMFFDALLLGVLALSKMARMDLTLTAFALIPMSLLLVIATVLGKYMKYKWRLRQEAFSDISDFVQENFSGIGVIKAFTKELLELMAFKRLNRKNEEINIAYTKASTLLHVLVTLFVESVVCIILGYGGYLVYTGVFNAGELIEFISYFTSIVWPIMAVSQLIEMASRGAASVRRVSELLDAEVTVKDAAGVKEAGAVRGDIEFRNLTFRYPGAAYDALTDVSFKINQGESVGIIGRTGAGKTTIVDLILRIYNVENGTLFIDSEDVNGLSISSLRKSIAYVPQDNFLFSDTIENNISFAYDEVDIEGVRRAARIAEVDDNVAGFTDGYKTVLGERGITVSGGQKQRISIARAIMKDAPILILDDSVSAVDTDTEQRILKNLSESRRGKTTILIAHRVSTVESMDKIIYVDNGRVLAIGTHAQLCATCPQYNNMVKLQRLDDMKMA